MSSIWPVKPDLPFPELLEQEFQCCLRRCGKETGISVVDDMDDNLLQMIALIAGPTGGAWIAVKTTLNGTRAQVSEIAKDVSAIRESLSDHRVFMSRLDERLKNVEE